MKKEKEISVAVETQTPKKKRGISISTILCIIVFLIGLGIMLYPVVSNFWNKIHFTGVISNYLGMVDVKNADYSELWAKADEYNESLLQYNSYSAASLAEEKNPEYNKILLMDKSDVMAVLEIKTRNIDIRLPVYHGTSESVLQVGVGHLPGTSFPTGKKGTHTVISGHTGLPSAELLTDLDQLRVGDEFTLRILDQVFLYEIDQILVVLPEETSHLNINRDKDWVTIITCTPYGVNDHRLLVRGVRVGSETVEGQRPQLAIMNEAEVFSAYTLAPVLAIPCIIFFLLLIILISALTKSRE